MQTSLIKSISQWEYDRVNVISSVRCSDVKSWLSQCHYDNSNQGATSAPLSALLGGALRGGRYEKVSAIMWSACLHDVQQDFELIRDVRFRENLSGAALEPVGGGQGHVSSIWTAERQLGAGEIFRLLLTHRGAVLAGGSFGLCDPF